MKESEFLVKIRGILQPADVLHVETSMDRGVPDLNVCRDGKEAWIELKVPDKRGALLRPAQYAWGMRRASIHGGKVFVLAYEATEGFICAGWKYPFAIEPFSKYVRIIKPRFLIPNKEALISFLFT